MELRILVINTMRETEESEGKVTRVFFPRRTFSTQCSLPTLPAGGQYRNFGNAQASRVSGLTLNGVNQYIDMGGLTSSDVQGAMTFAFRATQLSMNANYERIFDFDNGCGSSSIRPS